MVGPMEKNHISRFWYISSFIQIHSAWWIEPKVVNKIALIKSIAYASIPIDSMDNINNARQVPIIIYNCVNLLLKEGKYILFLVLLAWNCWKGITKQGIFRASGSEKRIAQLYNKFDMAPDFGLNWYVPNTTPC